MKHHQRSNFNTTGNQSPNEIEEITLTIALLGGVIAALLYISDYFNNNALESDSNLKPLVYAITGLLLIELLIIFLFFIFKGIAAYENNNTKKDEFNGTARDLFKISFVIALSGFIASILIGFFKVVYIPPPTDLYGFIVIRIGYLLILLITGVVTIAIIPKTVITETKIVNEIIGKFQNIKTCLKILKFYTCLRELYTYLRTLKFYTYFKIVIIIIFFFILIIDVFFLVPQYLLTGSYSIEEFSPPVDNPNIHTFTVKEKGVGYDLINVELVKLNSSNLSIPTGLEKDTIDSIKTYRNVSGKNSCYLWVTNINMIWYLNIINSSNLSSGTYLLHAEVKNDLINNSVIGMLNRIANIGVSKRSTEKLFYIPPERAKANNSFKCTQTS